MEKLVLKKIMSIIIASSLLIVNICGKVEARDIKLNYIYLLDAIEDLKYKERESSYREEHLSFLTENETEEADSVEDEPFKEFDALNKDLNEYNIEETIEDIQESDYIEEDDNTEDKEEFENDIETEKNNENNEENDTDISQESKSNIDESILIDSIATNSEIDADEASDNGEESEIYNEPDNDKIADSSDEENLWQYDENISTKSDIDIINENTIIDIISETESEDLKKTVISTKSEIEESDNISTKSEIVIEDQIEIAPSTSSEIVLNELELKKNNIIENKIFSSKKDPELFTYPISGSNFTLKSVNKKSDGGGMTCKGVIVCGLTQTHIRIREDIYSSVVCKNTDRHKVLINIYEENLTDDTKDKLIYTNEYIPDKIKYPDYSSYGEYSEDKVYNIQSDLISADGELKLNTFYYIKELASGCESFDVEDVELPEDYAGEPIKPICKHKGSIIYDTDTGRINGVNSLII